MKILIGAPIHKIKDYAIERWLQNVAKLQLKYPADLLLVDNSPGLDYVERVKGYCIKYGIRNYKIEHSECNQGMTNDEIEIRIEKSQLIISRELLFKDYDAWFSWECDQIIPPDALNKLVKIQEMGNFMIVIHNSLIRVDTSQDNFGWGLTLVKRECLEKYGFLLPWVSKADYSDIPDNRKFGEECAFHGRVFQNGGNFIEVDGIIRPIYHLSE